MGRIKPNYMSRDIGVLLLFIGGGAAFVGGWGWLWAFLACIAGFGFLSAQKRRFRQLVDHVSPRRPEVGPGGFCFRVQVDGEEGVDIKSVETATAMVNLLAENDVEPWVQPGEKAWSSREILLIKILRWEHGISIPVQMFVWNWETLGWDENWSVEVGREAVLGSALEADTRLKQQQAMIIAQMSHRPSS